MMFRFLALFCFSMSLLFAHPHTFIEVYPTIEVKNNKTTKIQFKWQLDEMTSSMLIMEFDQNGDGKLDKSESNFVYENYFIELKKNNFYTDIKVKDKIKSFPNPINFKVTIENNKICYYFEIVESYNSKDLKLDFGDKDFFVAMILKKEFIKTTGVKTKVVELDNDFYFGYRLELN